jgi:ParB-like chromosome segregation protein Spo0J
MEAAMPERPRARDRYEHHPLAEMFPLLKDAELHELVEDIRKHGLREPISLFEQKIIDGRNRERACIKAGVEPRYRSIEFDNHDAAAAYVISKNICRRHLTPKQKRALIEKVLRADPTKSDRQIARAVKADNKTVGAVRKRAEARGEIPHVLKRTDSKGRSQVAHKRNSANKRTNSTIDLNDQCIEGVRETIERTIKDLRRTGATTFERLFAALVKVIEDIERKTITMRMRNSFPEKREASSCPPGLATQCARRASMGAIPRAPALRHQRPGGTPQMADLHRAQRSVSTQRTRAGGGQRSPCARGEPQRKRPGADAVKEAHPLERRCL